MESLYLLIPIAIIFVVIAVVIFLWAVKSDQFEDLERQGSNILFDEQEISTDKDKDKEQP
jgi:cbb3-type cytochrome oxidase maturation protein